MSPNVQRLFVGHMGCYAALPGLGSVGDYVVARGRPALLLCAELTSLHLQPASTRCGHPADRLARARSRTRRPPSCSSGRGAAGGTRSREVAAVTDTTTADHMTWEVTDLGFRMGLSPAGAGGAVAARAPAGRRPAGPAWADRSATWTAGRCIRADPRSSTWCEEQLELPPRALAASREVLRRVRKLLLADGAAGPGRAPPAGQPAASVVMLAFGPGSDPVCVAAGPTLPRDRTDEPGGAGRAHRSCCYGGAVGRPRMRPPASDARRLDAGDRGECGRPRRSGRAGASCGQGEHELRVLIHRRGSLTGVALRYRSGPAATGTRDIGSGFPNLAARGCLPRSLALA